MAIVRTAAYNPEIIRRRMWADVTRLPAKLIERAFEKLESQLEAKETKFFTHQGEVREQVDVAAHAIQQEAAAKILKVADAFARDERKSSVPQFRFEITPDGVFKLIVGSSSEMEVPDASLALNGANVDNSNPLGNVDGHMLAQVPATASLGTNGVEAFEVEEPVQIIRHRDHAREALRTLMYGKDGQA